MKKMSVKLVSLIVTLMMIANCGILLPVNSLANPPTETLRLEAYSPDGSYEWIDVPADTIDAPRDSKIMPPPPAFEVVKLRDSGRPDSQSVVITVMGDGFTSSQQNNFITQAREISNYLISRQPYSYYEDLFTVYAIKVISNVSGTSNNPNTTIDTYFHTSFGIGGIDRLLYFTGDGYNKANELLQYYTPECDLPMMLVNSTKYGGAGGDIPVVSLNESSNSMMSHELAHTLGLADEYWENGYESEGPNKTQNANTSTNKWRHFLNVGQIGIYPYGTSGVASRWYRPNASESDCEMGMLDRPMCEVCSAHLTKEIAAITGEDFYGMTNIENANVTSSSDFILPYSYYGCERLKTVTIPSSIERIERYAFLKCTALTTVTNYAAPQQIPTPGRDGDPFYGVDRSKVTLYVPAGTSAAYQSAGWTGFKQIIELGAANAETPVITSQPADQEVFVSNHAALTVKVADIKGQLSYQWYSNTSKSNNGGTAVYGATSATYYPPTTSEGTKYYYCVITNTDTTATQNQTATVKSSTAAVKVNRIPVVNLEVTAVTISGQPSVGRPVSFTAQTQGGVQTIKYAFYVIGDGKIHSKTVYSDSNTFSFTPSKSGNYSIRVYAIDSDGKKAVLSKQFTV
ncbi:MAG: PKD domain-containing protein [Ruminococcaceae bacterium]|nr:PKD domain-containing protein [Oscillospiraceae bacterium]